MEAAEEEFGEIDLITHFGEKSQSDFEVIIGRKESLVSQKNDQ